MVTRDAISTTTAKSSIEGYKTKRREIRINAELRSLREKRNKSRNNNEMTEECLECGERFPDSLVLKKHFAEAHQFMEH